MLLEPDYWNINRLSMAKSFWFQTLLPIACTVRKDTVMVQYEEKNSKVSFSSAQWLHTFPIRDEKCRKKSTSGGWISWKSSSAHTLDPSGSFRENLDLQSSPYILTEVQDLPDQRCFVTPLVACVLQSPCLTCQSLCIASRTPPW